jgi:myo-inositol-1(or 4)-monophosphatase
MAVSLERELTVAAGLALRAGQVLRRHRAGPLQVTYKAHGEPVTGADLEADDTIRAGLATAFPDDAIYSEEAADTPERLTARRVWIVDPLDSTSNFIDNGNEYAVSIGLAIEGEAVLGVVYAPAREQLFAGAEQLGVRVNGIPVRISVVSDLAQARVTVSRKEWRRGFTTLPGGRPLLPLASMAHKLARVAAGLDDAVVSTKARKEWGMCAGVALVRAAGGHITRLDGRPVAFNREAVRPTHGVVAANRTLHALLLEQLRAAG